MPKRHYKFFWWRSRSASVWLRFIRIHGRLGRRQFHFGAQFNRHKGRCFRHNIEPEMPARQRMQGFTSRLYAMTARCMLQQEWSRHTAWRGKLPLILRVGCHDFPALAAALSRQQCAQRFRLLTAYVQWNLLHSVHQSDCQETRANVGVH
jgi:hypothetical protein